MKTRFRWQSRFLAAFVLALCAVVFMAGPAYADKGTFGTPQEPLTTREEIITALNSAGPSGQGGHAFTADTDLNTIVCTNGTLRNRVYINPQETMTIKIVGGMGVQTSNSGITVVDGQLTIKNEGGSAVTINKLGSGESAFWVGTPDPEGTSQSNAKLVFDGNFTSQGHYLATVVHGEIEVKPGSTITAAAGTAKVGPIFAVGALSYEGGKYIPQNTKATAKLTINGKVDMSPNTTGWSAIAVTGGENAICEISATGEVKGNNGINGGRAVGPLIQVGSAEVPGTLIVKGKVEMAEQGAPAIKIQGGAKSTVTIEGEAASVKGGGSDAPAIEVGYAGQKGSTTYPPSGGTLIIENGKVENADTSKTAIKSVTGNLDELGGEAQTEVASNIQINGGEVDGDVDITGPGTVTVGGGEDTPTITGGITNENEDSTINIKSGEVKKNVTNKSGTTNIGSEDSEKGPTITGNAENQGGNLNVFKGSMTDVVASANAKATNLKGGEVSGKVQNTGDNSVVTIDGADVKGDVETSGQNAETIMSSGSKVGGNVENKGTNSKVKIDGAEVAGNVTTNGENATTEIDTGKVKGKVETTQGETNVGKPGVEPPTVEGEISGSGTNFYDAVDDDGKAITPSGEGVKVYVTVTFDPKEGALTSEKLIQTDEKGSLKIQDPGTPTRSGYRFLGWMVEGTNKVIDLKTFNPETNTTLVPKWEKVALPGGQKPGTQKPGDAKQFTVIFDANGGSWGGSRYQTQKVASGKTASVPSLPTYAGYEFVGWTLDGASVDPSKHVVAKDVTFVAQWKPVFGDTPSPEPEPKPEPANTVQISRLYNEFSGEHLYTTDANEANVLCSLGWTNEGVAWSSPKTGSSPVYRFYNAYTGEHLYTKDEVEASALLGLDPSGEGWTDEGIAFYSADEGTPVYRLYNAYMDGAPGSHLYTTDVNEYNTLPGYGWTPEDVAWYALP